MILQDPVQAPTSLAQVHANCGRARPDHSRDLLRRVTRVIAENKSGPLVWRESSETRDQWSGRVLHLVAGVVCRFLETSAITQLSGGNSKGGPPDPSLRVAKIVPATESLGEGLRNRIAGHLSVSGEGNEGAPQANAILPVEALKATPGCHHRVRYHTLTGRGFPPNV